MGQGQGLGQGEGKGRGQWVGTDKMVYFVLLFFSVKPKRKNNNRQMIWLVYVVEIIKRT